VRVTNFRGHPVQECPEKVDVSIPTNFNTDTTHLDIVDVQTAL